jgi:hypothetical protein
MKPTFLAVLVASVALVVAAVSGAAPLTPPVLASPGPSPFIGCTADNAAAQIADGSTLYPNSEVEPRSAINPTNSQNIVGFYQQDRWDDGGARGLVASVTQDGGATWHRVVVPGLTRCSDGNYDRASDPWLSFAPNGDLYAISLSFDFFDTHNAIIVVKSTDGGEHWGPPLEVTADNTNGLDKESITADPRNSNIVYATWDRLLSPGGSTHASDQGFIHAKAYKSQTFFSKTVDGGRTWSKPIQIYTDASFSGSIGGIIRVLPDGTLLDGLVTYGNAAWKGGKCASESVLRSTDGGAKWSMKPTIVSPLTCTYFGAHVPVTGAQVRSGGLIDIANDGNNVYAVWEDGTASEPTTGHILFSQSTDGGVTWSSPTVISKTPAGIDAFIPTVAVNSGHVLGVTYYDFREHTPAAEATTDVWLVRCGSSCTSASSWSETQVGGPFDLEQAPDAGGLFVGDYEAMTTSGTIFQPFFVQAVTAPANPTDAYFTTVP